MKTKGAYIFLENISLFAYHGVIPQERVAGNTFIINIRLKTDISAASVSDNLNDTVSYADIYNVVKEEMNIPSQLLEHVCGRIAEKLFSSFPGIEEINISLKKKNPPMRAADIDFSGVEMICVR